jgi:hypothetical protein
MGMYLRLSQVNEITVERLVLAKGQPIEIQLHGFCDSSEKAYGASLYLRSINQQGEVTTMQQTHNFNGISFLRIHHILEDCGKQVLSLQSITRRELLARHY